MVSKRFRSLALLSLLTHAGCGGAGTPPIGEQNEWRTLPETVVLPTRAEARAARNAPDDLRLPVEGDSIRGSADDHGPTLDTPVADSQSEEQIRELVVRNLIEGRTKTMGVFFIALDDRDPDDNFLARFADLNSPIRKASRAKKDGGRLPGELGYCDRITHERGVRVAVGKIHWLGPGRAELEGEVEDGIRFVERRTLVIEFVKSRWRVVGGKLWATS